MTLSSGSGSLLITIGKSVGRHIEDKNKVKYYAQELKENTYNLTRSEPGDAWYQTG